MSTYRCLEAFWSHIILSILRIFDANVHLIDVFILSILLFFCGVSKMSGIGERTELHHVYKQWSNRQEELNNYLTCFVSDLLQEVASNAENELVNIKSCEKRIEASASEVSEIIEWALASVKEKRADLKPDKSLSPIESPSKSKLLESENPQVHFLEAQLNASSKQAHLAENRVKELSKKNQKTEDFARAALRFISRHYLPHQTASEHTVTDSATDVDCLADSWNKDLDLDFFKLPVSDEQFGSDSNVVYETPFDVVMRLLELQTENEGAYRDLRKLRDELDASKSKSNMKSSPVQCEIVSTKTTPCLDSKQNQLVDSGHSSLSLNVTHFEALKNDVHALTFENQILRQEIAILLKPKDSIFAEAAFSKGGTSSSECINDNNLDESLLRPALSDNISHRGGPDIDSLEPFIYENIKSLVDKNVHLCKQVRILLQQNEALNMKTGKHLASNVAVERDECADVTNHKDIATFSSAFISVPIQEKSTIQPTCDFPNDLVTSPLVFYNADKCTPSADRNNTALELSEQALGTNRKTYSNDSAVQCNIDHEQLENSICVLNQIVDTIRSCERPEIKTASGIIPINFSEECEARNPYLVHQDKVTSFYMYVKDGFFEILNKYEQEAARHVESRKQLNSLQRELHALRTCDTEFGSLFQSIENAGRVIRFIETTIHQIKETFSELQGMNNNLIESKQQARGTCALLDQFSKLCSEWNGVNKALCSYEKVLLQNLGDAEEASHIWKEQYELLLRDQNTIREEKQELQQILFRERKKFIDTMESAWQAEETAQRLSRANAVLQSTIGDHVSRANYEATLSELQAYESRFITLQNSHNELKKEFESIECERTEVLTMVAVAEKKEEIHIAFQRKFHELSYELRTQKRKFLKAERRLWGTHRRLCALKQVLLDRENASVGSQAKIEELTNIIVDRQVEKGIFAFTSDDIVQKLKSRIQLLASTREECIRDRDSLQLQLNEYRSKFIEIITVLQEEKSKSLLMHLSHLVDNEISASPLRDQGGVENSGKLLPSVDQTEAQKKFEALEHELMNAKHLNETYETKLQILSKADDTVEARACGLSLVDYLRGEVRHVRETCDVLIKEKNSIIEELHTAQSRLNEESLKLAAIKNKYEYKDRAFADAFDLRKGELASKDTIIMKLEIRIKDLENSVKELGMEKLDTKALCERQRCELVASESDKAQLSVSYDALQKENYLLRTTNDDIAFKLKSLEEQPILVASNAFGAGGL